MFLPAATSYTCQSSTVYCKHDPLNHPTVAPAHCPYSNTESNNSQEHGYNYEWSSQIISTVIEMRMSGFTHNKLSSV